MNEDGYTLVEMLAAISILAMLVAGLGECMHLFGRFQTDALNLTASAAEQAKIQRYLDDSFRNEGPFWSLTPRTLIGRSDRISYECGKAAHCVISIIREHSSELLQGSLDPSAPVRINANNAHFMFLANGREYSIWPARVPANVRLIAVSILDGRNMPMATARLQTTERAGCVFDIVALSCKEGS